MAQPVSCVAVLVCFLSLTTGYGAVEEYCPYETFRAACPENDVIMMTHALYGRMQTGRCVKETLGHLGCSLNALPFLDKACSGKQSCNYLVVGIDLFNTKPCPSDVSSYIEAGYDCVKINKVSDPYQCSKHSSILLDSAFGHVSSSNVHEEGWGTLTCPWVVTALPGQSINVTIITFDAEPKNRFCKPMGYATDTNINQNVTICNPSERVEHVMMSVGHSVTLQIIPAMAVQGNFLIEYQVHGCADLVAPDHAWHKRVGNDAIVGCEYHNKTWHLRCDGQTWIGVVGNCSSNKKDLSTENVADWHIFPKGFPFLLIIIGIVATTVLVGICIIVLVLMPKCACSKSSKQESYPHFDANSMGTSYGYASNKAHTRSSWACTFKSEANPSNHIWETPLPEPSAPPATEHMSATMRNPNPMETSITSSGGDYTWPTRFMSPSNHPQDLDYTHPSAAISPQQSSSNDDYTVPVNAGQSLLHDNKDAIESIMEHDDYMAPSEVKKPSESDNANKVQYPNLPTDTFKRQLNNILHNNQTDFMASEDSSVYESGMKKLGMDTTVEYAIPNNKRLSQDPTQEQPTEEEYTLPTNMRMPAQNEKNIPSAEQI